MSHNTIMWIVKSANEVQTYAIEVQRKERLLQTGRTGGEFHGEDVIYSGSLKMSKIYTCRDEVNDIGRENHMHKSMEPRKYNLVKNKNSEHNSFHGSRIN